MFFCVFLHNDLLWLWVLLEEYVQTGIALSSILVHFSPGMSNPF